MRRVDEFAAALVRFAANPTGQGLFHLEKALLVPFRVHAFPQLASKPRFSPCVDVDDGLGKGLRCFLRQVVTDAAGHQSVRVLAGELLGI